MARLAVRDPATIGVIVMVATTLTMAFGDALVKSVSAEFSLWQIYVARSLIAIPLVVALMRGKSRPVLPRSMLWATLRSLLLMLMWIAFYAALPVLSLSVVAAAYYTGPLFITLFSALLIGEPVGLRRWIAILVGFAGVLVIVRPGSDAFTWVTLLPVASAVFYALAAVVTRARCSGERPLALSLVLNVAFLVTGAVGTAAVSLWAPDGWAAVAGAFLLGPWAPMGPREAGLVLLMAVVIVAVSTGVAKAYQSGPSSLIATFDYSYLVFAALWGYAMFGEVPDVATLAGMALIGGAGLLTIPGGAKGSPRTARRKSFLCAATKPALEPPAT